MKIVVCNGMGFVWRETPRRVDPGKEICDVRWKGAIRNMNGVLSRKDID